MFCMVVELYIEFVVGRSSLHRKKFNRIRLVVLVLWNNFPCCPKRSSLLGFDILLLMYFWRWCTRHRKIRPNVFDVLCFEFSMYCIFRDRRMRPFLRGLHFWDSLNRTAKFFKPDLILIEPDFWPGPGPSSPSLGSFWLYHQMTIAFVRILAANKNISKKTIFYKSQLMPDLLKTV